MLRMPSVRIIRNVLLLSCLWPAAQSCIYDYDNTCPPDSFHIVNDWADAPQAAPGGMAYLFFLSQGGEPWRFDLPGREGGAVDLPDNEYSCLSYNDDTYSVRFRENQGFDGYVAYTAAVHAGAPLPARSVAAGQTLVECPDMMWGCSCSRVRLLPGRVEYGNSGGALEVSSARNLPLRQRQLTARYSFEISDVSNLEGVRGMSAMFSGLAGALNLASGLKESYPVRLPSAAARAGSATIAGEFVTFGIPREPKVGNYLSLMVELSDGRRFNYDFDVTDQVRGAPNPLDVHIKIQGLELEESRPGGATGGFEVGVDNWVNIVINING